jgi:cytidylate kinase
MHRRHGPQGLFLRLMKALLITIDGPSGAGKTTVSRRLAERLGYTYVDTGALYRAVAWVALSRGCGADDETLSELCENLVLEFKRGPSGPRLYANGEDVTDGLRTPQITMMASAVSARPVVRTYLLGLQRKLAKGGGVVFEGRDMGTVVFPEADIKFYLDARPEIRARRRHRELAEKNQKVTLPEVGAAMKKRDEDDSTRALAPLKPAADAIVVDSTNMGIEAVVETMMGHIEHC